MHAEHFEAREVDHDYKRNGTTTLFAALNILTGMLLGTCMPRHRNYEFLAFLKLIDKTVDKALDVHIIADNYGTHKHANVKAWLAKHPRFHMHFVPTSSSWLNLVERWFRDLTEKRIRRGSFSSVAQLVAAIEAYIAHHNKDPKPYKWTKTAEEIIAKVTRTGCPSASARDLKDTTLEDFIDLVDKTGVPIVTVTAGAFDLATASGRMTARILGAVARQESEHKAERQRAKHAELAAQGAPSGGTRPFGLTEVKRGADGRSYREEVPDEADAVREAARDIIAGAPVKAICRRWEAQGLRGTRGRPITPQVVVHIMTAEWVAGRRAGRPAQWPAILDEETWRLVVAVIKGRATGRS